MEYNAKVRNRLRRVEGQINGILRMIEEEQDCKAVITQLSAARTAIDRTIGVIVSENLVSCLLELEEDGENLTKEELVNQAVELLVKSR